MSDIKTTTRGGKRPGAGRPSAFGKSSSGTGVSDYKPKINPVKELEKLYKQLDKIKTKEELLIWQAKADILNKLLPYSAMKKPTASLETNNEVIPEMTVLTVKAGGEPKEPKEETPIKEDGGDFV